MGEKRSIEREILFVVEGKDDFNFLVSFIEDQFKARSIKFDDKGISDTCQILKLEGIHPLTEKIKVLTLLPNFTTVKRLGIILDADNSASSKFESAQSALKNNNLPVPDYPGKFFQNPEVIISTGIYVVHVEGIGMLETICLKSVESDLSYGCIRQYWNCLEELNREQSFPLPKNREKALCLAFLASRTEPVNSLGVAALKGCWNNNHEVFSDLRVFIREGLS